jgi:hypothetical protein
MTQEILDYSSKGAQVLMWLDITNAGYQSDPHNGRSQMGFVFLQNGTAISWTSSKQTLVTTSMNHSEIVALYEASRECIWLR